MHTSPEFPSIRMVSKNSIGKKVKVTGRGLGTLLFYGKTQFKAGTWCGVALDEPSVSEAVVKSPRARYSFEVHTQTLATMLGEKRRIGKRNPLLYVP